jgi:hypothetical protein
MYAIRSGLQKFGITPKFEIESIIRLYARWIREGKLKVSSDWNRDLGVTFTVQDPCQLVRKSFGDPVAEDLRFVVKSVVGEEHFIDMAPNRSNNYCCGGGAAISIRLHRGEGLWEGSCDRFWTPARTIALLRATTVIHRFTISPKFRQAFSGGSHFGPYLLVHGLSRGETSAAIWAKTWPAWGCDALRGASGLRAGRPRDDAPQRVRFAMSNVIPASWMRKSGCISPSSISAPA